MPELESDADIKDISEMLGDREPKRIFFANRNHQKCDSKAVDSDADGDDIV